jgi:hypothetical protein
VHLKRTPREEAQWARHKDDTEAVGWDDCLLDTQADNCVAVEVEEAVVVEFPATDGSLEGAADGSPEEAAGSLASEVDKILAVEVDEILAEAAD